MRDATSGYRQTVAPHFRLNSPNVALYLPVPPTSTIATPPEHVVLLDLDGNPIGTMDKRSVHTANTPLHSAFSIFLFDGKGNMLSQQRAHSKKTWPGIWSNACCGHPASGESHLDAAHRRLEQELGLTQIELMNALPNFRYRAELDGIVENEICPVFIGQCSVEPTPNPKEVAATEWIPWKTFADSCKGLTQTRFDSFSPWSHLEGQLLLEHPLIDQFVGTA
ncbi:MAG: isopentenyl-diphosphate Delta-isomerase [Opitutales bacterium]|jgi:isopentenyl-diphosphate Delta-isomerase|nr:isopentenyl-diphosphate Delta-isomerase [Opitutales bacterium]MBT5814824.1 isopentenyl-diphosphate Delta-isomerase [Opitutales bacterium]MBT6767375.1 isopentenyl-diphosphate Delta-isomerase [Opitutales bacterium]MBT7866451.1 isopentenyl-diphosphate Delta-isomerase [Opitutales bacterium]